MLGALKVSQIWLSVQEKPQTFHSCLRLLNDGLNYSQSWIGWWLLLWLLLLLLLRPVTLMTARRHLRSLTLVHLHVGIIEVIVDVDLIVR